MSLVTLGMGLGPGTGAGPPTIVYEPALTVTLADDPLTVTLAYGPLTVTLPDAFIVLLED